jgi:hypothetical protein
LEKLMIENKDVLKRLKNSWQAERNVV